MLQSISQWAVLSATVLGFFITLRSCFIFKKAQEPLGFVGAVVTIVFYGVAFVLLWQAGALSRLLP